SLKDLEALFDRLANAKTYYEVLDVGRAVDDKEIKRVYYSLARKFHPDLFRRHLDTDLHSRAEAAFARIAQAYETLRTPNLRSAYDNKIGFQRTNIQPPAAPTTESASKAKPTP